MIRRILSAWGGDYHAVSSTPVPSVHSLPIPTWQAATFHFPSPVPLWDAAAIAQPANDIDRLKQFCGETPLPLDGISRSSLDSLALSPPPLKPKPHRVRFPRQHLIYMCLGVLLGVSTSRWGSLSWNNTFCATAPVPASGSVSNISPIRPNVSLTASILGAGGIANAQTPNLIASLKPASPEFLPPVTDFPLTSGFGNRIHPISGDVRFHEGVDFGTPNGTPVKAAKQGTVAFAGWHGGYGKTVIVQHAADYETLYAHLDELLVNAGDRVPQGKILGLSGSTGYSTGPHLHFEIRNHQVAQNPMRYFAAVGTRMSRR